MKHLEHSLLPPGNIFLYSTPISATRPLQTIRPASEAGVVHGRFAEGMLVPTSEVEGSAMLTRRNRCTANTTAPTDLIGDRDGRDGRDGRLARADPQRLNRG
eukprot:186372-Chlamydomonas_euryale.AAC.1